MPTRGSNESFFHFKLVNSVPGSHPAVQLCLGRYRVLQTEIYEQLWLEATGNSIGQLLDSQRVDRDTLELLALETFRYSCRLRGYRSLWLELTREELMARIVQYCASNLGSKPSDSLSLMVSCRYTPPSEIKYLLQNAPDQDDFKSSSGSSSPSMPGYNLYWRSLAPQHGMFAHNRGLNSGRNDSKASKYIQYKYAKLMRERAQRATSKSTTNRVPVL